MSISSIGSIALDLLNQTFFSDKNNKFDPNQVTFINTTVNYSTASKPGDIGAQSTRLFSKDWVRPRISNLNEASSSHGESGFTPKTEVDDETDVSL